MEEKENPIQDKTNREDRWKVLLKTIDWSLKTFIAIAAVFIAKAQVDIAKKQQETTNRANVIEEIQKIIESPEGFEKDWYFTPLKELASIAIPELKGLLYDASQTFESRNTAARGIAFIAYELEDGEEILTDLINDSVLPDAIKFSLSVGLGEIYSNKNKTELLGIFDLNNENNDHRFIYISLANEIATDSISASDLVSSLKNSRIPIGAKKEIFSGFLSKNWISNRQYQSFLVSSLTNIANLEDTAEIGGILNKLSLDLPDFNKEVSQFDDSLKKVVMGIYGEMKGNVGREEFPILSLDAIRFFQTPNGTPTEGQKIDFIAIRSTGGISLQGDINWYTNPESKQGIHFLIGRDGEVVQLADPENMKAWHLRGYNSKSIGIGMTNWGELVRKGDDYYAWPNDYDYKVNVPNPIEVDSLYYEPYTQRQYAALNSLLKALIQKYGILNKKHSLLDTNKDTRNPKGIFGVDYFYPDRLDLKGNPENIIDWTTILK